MTCKDVVEVGIDEHRAGGGTDGIGKYVKLHIFSLRDVKEGVKGEAKHYLPMKLLGTRVGSSNSAALSLALPCLGGVFA